MATDGHVAPDVGQGARALVAETAPGTVAHRAVAAVGVALPGVARPGLSSGRGVDVAYVPQAPTPRALHPPAHLLPVVGAAPVAFV